MEDEIHTTYPELEQEVKNLKIELEDLRTMLNKKTGAGSADMRGTIAQPSTIPSSTIPAGTITKTQVSYETATLAFASGDTSKTATITSGSIVIGYYPSVVTGVPAEGELQLSISSTTLSGTRSASPGGVAAITYVVVLLKA